MAEVHYYFAFLLPYLAKHEGRFTSGYATAKAYKTHRSLVKDCFQ